MGTAESKGKPNQPTYNLTYIIHRLSDSRNVLRKKTDQHFVKITHAFWLPQCTCNKLGCLLTKVRWNFISRNVGINCENWHFEFFPQRLKSVLTDH